MRRQWWSAAIGTVIAVVTSTRAHAYRPFDSTDAAVAGAARCEIELGPVGLMTLADERVFVVPALVANFGLNGGGNSSSKARISGRSAMAMRRG
jgi:hypothetical protein